MLLFEVLSRDLIFSVELVFVLSWLCHQPESYFITMLSRKLIGYMNTPTLQQGLILLGLSGYDETIPCFWKF